jgi:hypothetical protein
MGAVTTHRMIRIRSLILLLVIATAAMACNGAPEGQLLVYHVKGRVFYKGGPMGAARIVFEKVGDTAQPPNSGPIRATVTTGPDGSFELMTYKGNDGALAGDYLVGISSTPPHSEVGLFTNTPGTVVIGNPDVLRGRYADPKSSGLKAVVKEQENELPPFHLK